MEKLLVKVFINLFLICLVSSVYAQQSTFSIGEVLIRFESGTEGRTATVKSSETSPVDLSLLKPEIDSLSERTGVPLAVARLNSGGWMTVFIDGSELNERLVDYFENRPGVAFTGIGNAPPPAPGVQLPPVLVQFEANTPESEILSQLEGGSIVEGLDRLKADLESDLSWPVTMRATEGGRLAIHVDGAALTQQLVEVLKALPEIEHAQLNRIMGIG